MSVYDVARGEQFIWIATSFGVVRLDPVTHAYTSYNQLGLVQRIFPLADNLVYASTLQSTYYFDGQIWNQVAITTTYPFELRSSASFSLDAQGNLWMFTPSQIYRLAGHVPPQHTPWFADILDETALAGLPIDADREPACDKWPAAAAYSYSYRTAAECQQYLTARQRGLNGFYAVEPDGSIWRAAGDRLRHFSADGSARAARYLPLVTHLASDLRQGVWIGTYNDGLLFATDSEVQHVPIGLELLTLQNTLSALLVSQGWTLIFIALPVWQAINRLRERRHSQERPA